MNNLATSTFAVTPNGLQVAGQPTFDQWLEFGHRLAQIRSAVQWSIGDWINYGENRWGEKYAQALDEFDYEYGYLRNMAWIARCFEVSRRSDKLSWSHHATLAGLEPPTQTKLMQEAASQRLSRAELRERVKETKVAPPVQTNKQPVVVESTQVKYECEAVVGEVGDELASDYVSFHAPELTAHLKPGQTVRIVVYIKA